MASLDEVLVDLEEFRPAVQDHAIVGVALADVVQGNGDPQLAQPCEGAGKISIACASSSSVAQSTA